MNEIRDAIAVCLRKGENFEDVRRYLKQTADKLAYAPNYKLDDDLAFYAQAIKDADFRP
jgi:hypothetical protein